MYVPRVTPLCCLAGVVGMSGLRTCESFLARVLWQLVGLWARLSLTDERPGGILEVGSIGLGDDCESVGRLQVLNGRVLAELCASSEVARSFLLVLLAEASANEVFRGRVKAVRLPTRIACTDEHPPIRAGRGATQGQAKQLGRADLFFEARQGRGRVGGTDDSGESRAGWISSAMGAIGK